MGFKQIIKFKRKSSPVRYVKREESQAPAVEEKVVETHKNKGKKEKEDMNEKVNKAEEIMNNMVAANNVKVVKKDRGLIERTESSKIVLTEDNRQVLND